MSEKVKYYDEDGNEKNAEQLDIFDEAYAKELAETDSDSEMRAMLREYVRDSDLIKQALSYYHTTRPSVGEEIRRDNMLLHTVIAPLLKLQYHKEGSYGDSWAKRGELEVFFNISRKFDRLENIMLNDALDEVDESYVDTVADLANYGLLWLTYIAREKPELFDKWVSSIYKDQTS